MNKTLTLFKVFLKNDYDLSLQGKKGRRNVAVVILLAVCMIPTSVMMYFSYKSIFDMGFTTLGLETGFVMPALMVGMLTFLGLPTILYFSQDLDVLLPLPIRATGLITAKTMLVSVSSLLLYLPFMGAVMAAYWQTGPDFVSLLLSIIVFLTFWIIPVTLTGLAIVLLMRFVPFFRSRDRFNMIFGILMILVSVCFGALSGYSSSDDGQFTELLLDPSVISAINYACIQASWAAQAIVEHSISGLLLYAGVSIGLSALFLWTAQRWYLMSVTDMREGGAKKRRTKDKVRAPFWAVFHAERRNLVHTPAYFLNCVLMAYFPIVMFAIFGIVLNIEAGGIDKILNEISFAGYTMWYLPAGGLLGFLLSMMGDSAVSTMFSRQGQNLFWMWVYPVSIRTQILGLAAASLLDSLIAGIILTVVVCGILKIGLTGMILVLIGALVTVLFMGGVGMLLDGWKPKLVWIDETASVKNNLNIVAEIFLSLALMGLLVFVAFILPFEWVMPFSYAMLVLFLAADIIFVWKGPDWIARMLRNRI